LWEKELKDGIHKPEEEAGFDKRCPYRTGHQLGFITEYLTCVLLGLSWKRYCKYWDDFFANTTPKV
jgi:hypothetical protein